MRSEYSSHPPLTCSPRVQAPCLDFFGWGDAVSGVAQATGNVLAAREQAAAARDAAKIAADAATHAADVQGKGAADTLDFTKAQAQSTAQQAEIDRQANYNQWAAHERGVSSIGEVLGLGGKEIPGYVPGIVPNFGAPAAPGPAAAARPAMNPVAPLAPSISDVFGGVAAPGAAGINGDPAQLAALSARMGGNAGAVNLGVPVLQPDGTYRIPPPVGTVGDYVGA